ncbi:MAG: hypothetical protein R3B07_33500 [Polyangiaceae bacterium]
MSATLDEVCAVAIAECFRGDGEILCSPIGTLPAIGARLAKLTFEPGLLMTDGVAPLVANVSALGDKDAAKVIEGWLPYRSVFDLVWHGRRHVMMGATQIDRYGNQNIACIGDFEKPRRSSSACAERRATPSVTPPATGCRSTPGECSWSKSMW